MEIPSLVVIKLHTIINVYLNIKLFSEERDTWKKKGGREGCKMSFRSAALLQLGKNQFNLMLMIGGILHCVIYTWSTYILRTWHEQCTKPSPHDKSKKNCKSSFLSRRRGSDQQKSKRRRQQDTHFCTLVFFPFSEHTIFLAEQNISFCWMML